MCRTAALRKVRALSGIRRTVEVLLSAGLSATLGCGTENLANVPSAAGGFDGGAAAAGGAGPTRSTGGSAATGCGIGASQCAGICVDLSADAANCGACGLLCPVGQRCLGGSCACPVGLTSCGNACVDAASDPVNCGACAFVCSAGQSCIQGSCQQGRAGGGAAATGGAGTGGVGTGGSAAGGTATGGAATGTGGAGADTGGAATGTGGAGADTGGAATGTGGADTGGAATGTGGADTGGAATGTGGADTGGAAAGGASGGVYCDVSLYDPNNPPRNLNLSGSLGAHDPTMIEADGVFYRFQTGGAIGVATSTNLTSWSNAGTALGTGNYWAPDIIHMGGQYHLYYSSSSFGSNDSCIGHATRASLTSGSWQNQGSTICTSSGDSYNAIDPDVALDENGTPWMAFGSFWDGIMLIELDLDGNRVGTSIEHLARGPARDGEGSFIVPRCGYYYLFVSYGLCCPGADGRTLQQLTYNISVGRSESIHGPYVDRDGTAMVDGGGSVVVEGDGGATYYAAGHGEWIQVGDANYIFYHAYPGPGNQAEFRIAELVWDDEGWPVQVGP